MAPAVCAENRRARRQLGRGEALPGHRLSSGMLHRRRPLQAGLGCAVHTMHRVPPRAVLSGWHAAEVRMWHALPRMPCMRAHGDVAVWMRAQAWVSGACIEAGIEGGRCVAVGVRMWLPTGRVLSVHAGRRGRLRCLVWQPCMSRHGAVR